MLVINLILNALVLLPVTATSTPDGMASEPVTGALVGAAVLVFIVLAVVSILVSLISMMASVRFARTDSFGEAFNFSAILAHIGRIGWASYILALIVLYLALFAVVVVLGIFGIITLGLGFLLFFALAPAFSILTARYVTLIYDSAPVPA